MTVHCDVEEAAQMAMSSLTPEKSKSKCDLAYQKLKNCHEEKNTKRITGKVLLAAFQNKILIISSTFWLLFSMLGTETNI